jgi:hypothetical protein
MHHVVSVVGGAWVREELPLAGKGTWPASLRLRYTQPSWVHRSVPGKGSLWKQEKDSAAKVAQPCACI